jgi:hypothetical protein
MAILAKTGDLGRLPGEEVVRVLSSLWKRSRITDTFFPRVSVGFLGLLSPR